MRLVTRTLAAVAPRPMTTSGAIQYGVPATVRNPSLAPMDEDDPTLARPKSPSLHTPADVSSTFAPLRSRCTTLFSCRYQRPATICSVYLAATVPGSPPKLLMTPRRSPPLQYCIWMWRVSPSYSHPMNSTMLGCVSLRNSVTSLMSAVIAEADVVLDTTISLAAKNSPDWWSRQQNTSPKAPLPRSFPLDQSRMPCEAPASLLRRMTALSLAVGGAPDPTPSVSKRGPAPPGPVPLRTAASVWGGRGVGTAAPTPTPTPAPAPAQPGAASVGVVLPSPLDMQGRLSACPAAPAAPSTVVSLAPVPMPMRCGYATRSMVFGVSVLPRGGGSNASASADSASGDAAAGTCSAVVGGAGPAAEAVRAPVLDSALRAAALCGWTPPPMLPLSRRPVAFAGNRSIGVGVGWWSPVWSWCVRPVCAVLPVPALASLVVVVVAEVAAAALAALAVGVGVGVGVGAGAGVVVGLGWGRCVAPVAVSCVGNLAHASASEPCAHQQEQEYVSVGVFSLILSAHPHRTEGPQGYVRVSGRNRINPHRGEIERLTTRTLDPWVGETG